MRLQRAHTETGTTFESKKVNTPTSTCKHIDAFMTRLLNICSLDCSVFRHV